MSKRLQVYETDGITVTYDPGLCVHAAECVRGLPDVFAPGERRWIRPERAAPEAVAEVVGRCPTGALQATLKGASPVPPATSPADRSAVTITVTAGGPLVVRGPIRVEREGGEVLLEGEKVALCRCGRTGRPPFCDGSHAGARLRD
jgi:uncharacterized Fe-S cluster protein YjdI